MSEAGAGVDRRSRPGLRRPGGKRGSIREVRLVGVAGSAAAWAAGDRVGWWGRSYEVAAAEVRPVERSPQYLHLRPTEAPGKSASGLPVGASVG